jgi:uncharacterized coiled-coil protein SlyX
MGKMKIGSGGKTKPTVSKPVDAIEPIVATSEKILTVEIPKPVVKDVIVEIPKPIYKVVEVEEVVKKPKIRVDEVTQSVIKPVFTIKQETIVLDQLQKKLDESVSLASSKLNILNSTVVEQNKVNDESIKRIENLTKRVSKLQTAIIVSVICSVLVVISSFVG